MSSNTSGDLGWSLKAAYGGNQIDEFPDRASLTFTAKYLQSVPAKGTAVVTPTAGWTKGIRLFLIDFGNPDLPIYWGFDNDTPVLADGTLVVAGEAACSALLRGRKSIAFKNGTDTDKPVTILIAHLDGLVTIPATVPPTVKVSQSVSLEVTEGLVVNPDLPATLDAGSFGTTLPDGGFLSAPIEQIADTAGLAAFVISAANYPKGLEFSLDKGTKWIALTQPFSLFGIEACKFLPANLTEIQFRNSSGMDLPLGFAVGRVKA